jgi:2-methylcitrate dehydratase PrpD
LIDGRPTLASFTDEAVNRKSISDLIDLIEVRVPPHLSEDIPAVRKAPFEQPVTLEVETKDGHVYSEIVHIHKGSPLNPVTDLDLKQKFLDCAGLHMNAEKSESILSYLEKNDANVRELMKLVSI